MNKTTATRKEDIEQGWHFMDADGQVLGRLATKVATLLIGKNKANYSPNQLMGDKVVVTNASKVAVTGKKFKNKIYYRHSGYPGGLKEESYEEIFRKDPTKVIRNAVDGMLPRNKLRKKMLVNLYVYSGEDHPHKAQQKGK